MNKEYVYKVLVSVLVLCLILLELTDKVMLFWRTLDSVVVIGGLFAVMVGVFVSQKDSTRFVKIGLLLLMTISLQSALVNYFSLSIETNEADSNIVSGTDLGVIAINGDDGESLFVPIIGEYTPVSIVASSNEEAYRTSVYVMGFVFVASVLMFVLHGYLFPKVSIFSYDNYMIVLSILVLYFGFLWLERVFDDFYEIADLEFFEWSSIAYFIMFVSTIAFAVMYKKYETFSAISLLYLVLIVIGIFIARIDVHFDENVLLAEKLLSYVPTVGILLAVGTSLMRTGYSMKSGTFI